MRIFNLSILVILALSYSEANAQTREDRIARILQESAEIDYLTAINTIKDVFPKHVSSTEPYVLVNNSAEFEDSNPCLCSLVIDEYYKKINSPEKRTIVYDFDIADISLSSKWINDGEIFNIKMEKESVAEVQVYVGNKVKKQVSVNMIEFASPQGKEDDLMIAFYQLKRLCEQGNIITQKENTAISTVALNEAGIPLKIEKETSKTQVIPVLPDLTSSGDEIVSEKPTYKLMFKILSDSQIPINDIHIDVNNNPIVINGKKTHYSSSKVDDGYSHSYSNTIDLIYGSNLISIAIKTADGVVGLEPFTINYLPQKPNLFLYSIGIPSDDLKYTQDDAEDFSSIFDQMDKDNSLFDQIKIKRYTSSEETTKQALARSIENIKNDYALKDKIGKNDVMILYLSSHGYYDKEAGKYKIAASNYDPLYSNSSSLDFENDILDVIAGVNCKKIFFIDACYSGSIDYQKYDGAKNTSADEVELARSISVLVNGRNDSYFVMSSSQDEKSYEDDLWSNGAYTEAIVKGLTVSSPHERTKIPADSNNDKIIYLFELVDYLQEKVPALVNTKRPKPVSSQNPILIDGLSKLDIPIFSY